ncbi:MAG: hypothetical protein HS111_29390 [Kofleriaceae bacterium]|nr:hypothetical protein [Kofleriaceae bacterium]
MKGVIVHGALLAVMLVYGYLTWTKEKPAATVTGDVVMWNRGEPELKAIELAATDQTLRLERRGEGAAAYWWGIDSRTTKKMKPVEPPPPPAPGEAPPPPPEPEWITETTVREFPVGEPGEKLVRTWRACARSARWAWSRTRPRRTTSWSTPPRPSPWSSATAPRPW